MSNRGFGIWRGKMRAYPEHILHASHQIMCRRLALLREDEAVGTHHHVHHWQWGKPAVVRSVDPIDAWRAPADLQWRIAPLSSALFRPQSPSPRSARRCGRVGREVGSGADTVVRLVNLNPNEGRELIIQAGGFGEHRFGKAEYVLRTSEWPGEVGRICWQLCPSAAGGRSTDDRCGRQASAPHAPTGR